MLFVICGLFLKISILKKKDGIPTGVKAFAQSSMGARKTNDKIKKKITHTKSINRATT